VILGKQLRPITEGIEASISTDHEGEVWEVSAVYKRDPDAVAKRPLFEQSEMTTAEPAQTLETVKPERVWPTPFLSGRIEAYRSDDNGWSTDRTSASIRNTISVLDGTLLRFGDRD